MPNPNTPTTPRRRLTALTHAQGSTTLAGYTWTYDSAGRITQATSTADGTVNYSYDATDQLTGADYSTSQTDESYSYDSNGNRTNTGYSTGTDNRLLSDGTYAYQYDNEGNRTARFIDVNSNGVLDSGDTSITIYVWDYRNRLSDLRSYSTYTAYAGQTPSQVVDYLYDAFNRLVGEDTDSNGDSTLDHQTRFIYDGNNPVLQFDKSGPGDLAAANLTHRYLYGPAVNQILADEQVTSLTSPGTVIWPLTDQLGTPRDLAIYNSTTSTTTIANHRVYNAFGVLHPKPTPRWTSSSASPASPSTRPPKTTAPPLASTIPPSAAGMAKIGPASPRATPTFAATAATARPSEPTRAGATSSTSSPCTRISPSVISSSARVDTSRIMGWSSGTQSRTARRNRDSCVVEHDWRGAGIQRTGHALAAIRWRAEHDGVAQTGGRASDDKSAVQGQTFEAYIAGSSVSSRAGRVTSPGPKKEADAKEEQSWFEANQGASPDPL